MIWNQFVSHLRTLLQRLADSPETAADEVLAAYGREHQRLGSRDRGQLADAFFAVLRRRDLWVAWVLAHGEPGEPGEGLALLASQQVGSLTWAEAWGPDQQAWLRQAQAAFDGGWGTAAQRLHWPQWLLDALQSQDVPDLQGLAQALLVPAPVDLRVNVQKAKRDKLLSALQAQDWPVQATPYSPWGLRLEQRRSLKQTEWFQAGMLEVQDEGSQLLSALLGAKRGETVVDFCAGAGGKTLALGAMMRDQGRLMAMDVSAARLAAMQPRLKRAGLTSVYSMALQDERDARLQGWRGKASRVLVDAPCTGLGTLRRNPELKWRLTPAAVTAYASRQRDILQAAARLVQPGGRLVYATCSLLQEENEDIAQAFTAEHRDFRPVDAQEALAPVVKDDAQRNRLCANGYLRLWPHVHGTDGFFAAVWQRVD